MKNNENVYVEFKSLIGKFHSGNCSLDELQLLEEMFMDSVISEDIKNKMLDDLHQNEEQGVGSDADYDRLFKSIQKVISEQQSSKRAINLRFNLLRIAAIVVLAFILGGTISYFAFSNKFKHADSFCEVTAPLGSTSEIVLPDNSRVWLNAGSKIRYSTSFNKNDRMLYLEGEGYFKVSKNKKLPFIVDAFGFEVKAVGTEFNVKAYKDDATIETTMVEGKVSLQHASGKIMEGVNLLPNQKATFYKRRDALTIEVLRNIEAKKEELNYIPEFRLVIAPKINPQAVISWKENQLIIESQELSELTEILSRKYNFNFKFKSDDIKKFRFSGTLKDETLQQVMDVIKISSPIDYVIDGKTVFIERNDKRVPEFEKLLKQQ
ncbi:MAG TPA: FecR family protein [Prolixibacteraceae bacterium]|nr:FecR family protein [Prolixibacteraceae bacterium]